MRRAVAGDNEVVLARHHVGPVGLGAARRDDGRRRAVGDAVADLEPGHALDLDHRRHGRRGRRREREKGKESGRQRAADQHCKTPVGLMQRIPYGADP